MFGESRNGGRQTGPKRPAMPFMGLGENDMAGSSLCGSGGGNHSERDRFLSIRMYETRGMSEPVAGMPDVKEV